MLPDFPAAKKRLDRAFRGLVQQEVLRRSPILREVSRISQHEGNKWAVGQPPGGGDGEDYRRLEAEFTMSRDEMRSGGMEAVRRKYEQVAEVFAEHQTKNMFEKIGAAAEGVGNVVRAHGEPLSQEHFLELFERIETEYDPETREPKNTMFVMHPDMAKNVIPKVKEWEEDPEFQRKLKEIHERKWREWRARESRRRLAD